MGLGGDLSWIGPKNTGSQILFKVAVHAIECSEEVSRREKSRLNNIEYICLF